MDEDVEKMDFPALVAEAKRLRDGIRAHRDCSGHDLCWYHPELWGLLPENTLHTLKVPKWPQFLRGCIKYRASLDKELPEAERTREEAEA
ncbi:MAG: hypothetical protein HY052_04970 [Proteobacteria bacterium]|nr:hypothetical protein [Pseudomonadota bacterium]